jgi:hypothetical protein
MKENLLQENHPKNWGQIKVKPAASRELAGSGGPLSQPQLGIRIAMFFLRRSFMTDFTPKQWADLMARQICKSIQTGSTPNEKMLADMFHGCIAEVLLNENNAMLDELTNLAFKEQDSGKRAGYFKLARLIQARMPKKEADSKPHFEPSLAM